MKTLMPLLLLILLIGCEKESWEYEEPYYPTCNIVITNIKIDPDTLLEGMEKYLNIKVQHHVFTRDSTWVWCDQPYEDRIQVEWRGKNCRFSFKVKEKDMAIKIKPSMCGVVILGFDMTINDSLVEVRKRGIFYRIRI
jgi:hypothetical protein